MLVNASVVDTVTGAVRRGQVLVLRDGRIESVGAAAPAAASAAAPRRIDLGGRYVVPGLIDAHVHIANPAGDARRARERRHHRAQRRRVATSSTSACANS